MTDMEHLSNPTQISLDDVPDLCRLLKLFGNPKRLKILLFLLEKESSVGEIESSLGIKQPNLSHELKKLRDAKLVTTKRQSKTILYSLKSTEIKTLLVSVRRTFNQSNQVLANQPIAETTSDSNPRSSECGLFAKIESPQR